ncbi:MAG TPA: hypothetical protein GX742_02370 [Acholeplasmataceae bacterium]|nr:hypothetical protein [Acholeplasmataceae bacterium]
MISSENYLDFEIPKYKKRSKKRKASKSDHKHDYSIEVLIKRNSRYGERYHYANRCRVCGKTGEEKFFESQKINENYFRVLTQKEILEKYKDLPVIEEN